MEPNTQINFTHPFTVFVGQNGCGKSSALTGLAGAPSGTSVGNYWFSTAVDPIREDVGRPNCIIFKYFNKDANRDVEVIKTRGAYNKNIKRADGTVEFVKNPDYWEPKRADVGYQMELPALGDDGTPEPGSLKSKRWIVPSIPVEYIDFRSELSAFDQYFYFGEKPQNLKRYRSKQDRLRAWLKNRLAPVLSGSKKLLKSRDGKALNDEMESLSHAELSVVSEILGKVYTSCQMINHRFFDRISGYSVMFRQEGRQYSEAFAGSGEMAVVRVVTTVMRALPKSLILLDEPEVSLHPGAQKRLRIFLLKEIAERAHQVVMCTHSPVFLEGLPPKCIKVFVPSTLDKFRVVEDVSSTDAFVQIGHSISGTHQLIVEDKSAQLIVEHALQHLGGIYPQIFEVVFWPGGSSAIFKDLIVYARQNDQTKFVLFDGDCYVSDWPEEGSVTDNNLPQTIASLCGQSVEKLGFRMDSNTSQKQKLELYREYLQYLSTQCLFLPGLTPEELIWLSCRVPERDECEASVTNTGKNRFKDFLGAYAKQEFGEDTAENRRFATKQLLHKYLDHDSLLFKELIDKLEIIRSRVRH